MEKIKIMHIGDIHYPKRHSAHLAEIKEKSANRNFIGKITPKKSINSHSLYYKSLQHRQYPQCVKKPRAHLLYVLTEEELL